ncbi:glycosyltransferase family 2 protein [Gaiella occulta]|uniref:glycosyltransferase family 2 protein n=1 Tax=Gaiella occulta TaxID=1002870 RepID=UPI0015F08526|nr:glycosyltransferase [Gaiella occulta]
MAPTSTPLVSVLVTARDNERHVGAALTSVLRQTLTSLELLVVDDGSADATPAIVESLRDERLRFVRFPESRGISARRNELLERARGRYVAPLDADDVWLPDRLERHVRLLESRPDLVAVGSDVLVVDDGVGVGRYFRLPRSDAAIRWNCLFTSPLIHSASTIRASAFHDGVRYDPAYPLAQDYDLWTKLLRRGRSENLAVPLTLYRVHSAQASQRRACERRAEQERIGLRAIEDPAGGHGPTGDRARLAWCLGAAMAVADEELEDAIDAYRELFARIESAYRGTSGLREARRIAATTLLRRAGLAADAAAWALRRAALAIDRRVTVSAVAVRAANIAAGRRYRRPAARLLADLAEA